MGMDIDYIVAKQYIEKLEKILSNINYGGRENIADDIIEFVDKMEIKYQS